MKWDGYSFGIFFSVIHTSAPIRAIGHRGSHMKFEGKHTLVITRVWQHWRGSLDPEPGMRAHLMSNMTQHRLRVLEGLVDYISDEVRNEGLREVTRAKLENVRVLIVVASHS